MSQDIAISIGKRLKSERKAAGFLQHQLATLCKICRNSQSGYEVGDRTPTAEYLHEIHKHGLDILYILTGTRACFPAIPTASPEPEQPWIPKEDESFVIRNPSNHQDGLSQLLYVCLDRSLPHHVIGRPILPGPANRIAPVLLPIAAYEFTPGDMAVKAMGLADEVANVVKLRHQNMNKPADS